ncbi:MAG: T9SS type A sorting domain-containing protein [Paludibacteraceae bacterium]
MKKSYLSLLFLCLIALSTFGANVTITMNSISTTMTFANKSTGTSVDVGTPANYVYSFNANTGTYILNAINTNGISNGTIEIEVNDAETQSFNIVTVTAGATNTGWTLGTDYTLEYRSVGKEGAVRTVTAGTSTTANRITFPMFVGDSYFINIIPSASHTALVDGEKYMKTGLFGTVTASSVTAQGAAMQGSIFNFTVPQNANLFVGEKMGAVTQGTGGLHYIPFPEKEPIGQTTENGKTTYQFLLGTGSSINYNYRVSQSGKITNAGKFTRNSYTNSIEITEAMLDAYRPDSIDHNPASNGGANVGDILMNINAQGYLKLTLGSVRSILALRSWQLTDDCCNNYFIEPDFHYKVLNENGQPDNNVITIDNKGLITAVGNGTAIVQVTYDAVSMLSHKYTASANTTLPFYYGSFWGAIWPENTGTFVVSVGTSDDTSINTNMLIRENLPNGGKVDAEFDVFYYHEDSIGYRYNFKPEGVASVSIANPTIGAHSANYTGFTPITANADGSYTVLLTFGSNIVKVTSTSGVSKYQVLRAKPCGYTIANNTRPGQPILPGEEAYIQFHGFFHPANKLAGIYNQAAAVLYNNTPNSTTIVGGANQYTFGGAPAAQLVKVTIPSDWNPQEDYLLQNGAIQVNGFGSLQGKHRSISTVSGVAPNFTAEVRVGYFGSIPNVAIPVEALTDGVYFTNFIEGATITVKSSAKEIITANSEGQYIARPRTNYTYEISIKGYQTAMGTFNIVAGQGVVTIPVSMLPIATSDKGWDGTHIESPAQVTAEESDTEGGIFENMLGYYKITNGYELAWLSYQTLQGNNALNAVLVNDIELGNYAWTPIGASTTAYQYKGIFNGNNHTVKQLHINSTASYQGLFGYINATTLSNLTVEGAVNVTGTGGYVAGIVAYSAGGSTISNCHNKAIVNGYRFVGGILGYSPNAMLQILDCSNSGDITSLDTYAGGIAGCVATSASAVINRIFNSGNISATTNNAGGIIGRSDATPIINAFNTGTVTTAGTAVAGISASITAAGSITNAYNAGTVKSYAIANTSLGTLNNVYTLGNTYTDAVVKTASQFASGEVTWLLGSAFGQEINTDALPVLGGYPVYKVTFTNNLDTESDSLYTNGDLPKIEKAGYVSSWLSGVDDAVVTTVNADTNLHIQYTIDISTGLNNNKLQLSIYPNPFTEYIIVKSEKNQTMKIFNISGQCVINTQLKPGDNRIDVRSLPKGNYLLQCSREVLKLIK